VITVPTGVRVLVATKPVGFRRGADSLAAPAKEVHLSSRRWRCWPRLPRGEARWLEMNKVLPLSDRIMTPRRRALGTTVLQPGESCSRSKNFWIFPEAVCGNWSTNRQIRGTL